MFNRNEIWAGLLFALLLPAVSFVFLYHLFGLFEKVGIASGEGFSASFRERTLSLIALTLNLIPMHIYRRRRWDFAMRGVAIATGLLAFAWLLWFGRLLI
ncbi:MAG: hypothetical protein NZM43_05640 [Saprospiraceae bacterium]|nr:hypothetical protein [Saprospiraceae bacterium]MDW8483791.1 hypothetical protein [Saprospiraceae bacterium]